MTLLRGFSQVDEQGKIVLGQNFMTQAGLKTDSLVGLKVVRIKNSSRKPYLIIHRLEQVPRFAGLERIFWEGIGQIDSSGRFILGDEVMWESGFEPGFSLELKLAGPGGKPWLVIRSRGQSRLTTLQEKMGLKRKSKWQVMKMEY